MKITLVLILTLLAGNVAYSQEMPKAYTEQIKKAYKQYEDKDYHKSATLFSKAFEANGWEGLTYDRYNAACSWALAKNTDSAFSQLYRIANNGNYKNYDHIVKDTDLESLHDDKRWQPLLAIIKANFEREEAKLNKPLIAQLDSIHNDDQYLRKQIDSIVKKYGFKSEQVNEKVREGKKLDSINLIKVKAILDKYGWLGSDEIGTMGNTTLFLVIQHSDLKTQEHYLPMMKEAVKQGKAEASSLALLEDRILLRNGKKQIYGSQIGRDIEKGEPYVSPLEDPENVDKRRANVGLEPMKEYAERFKLKWDAAQYKKDLPAIEMKFKAMMEKYGKL
jgi:hypothetical protein